jgi:hypothetical protein
MLLPAVIACYYSLPNTCNLIFSQFLLQSHSHRAFVTQAPLAASASITARSSTVLQMKNMFTQNARPSTQEQFPAPIVPERFQTPPEPRPLTVTSLSSLPGLATGAAALIIRAGAGATVYGWKPEFGEAAAGEYSLKYGILPEIRDTCAEVASFNKPSKPIVLYEYEASPYCRKVNQVYYSYSTCTAIAAATANRLTRSAQLQSDHIPCYTSAIHVLCYLTYRIFLRLLLHCLHVHIRCAKLAAC